VVSLVAKVTDVHIIKVWPSFSRFKAAEGYKVKVTMGLDL